jgi:hypothetical protein
MTDAESEIVTAIYDLARITVAFQGNVDSRADAIRQLAALSIPPVRIARIMGVPLNQVTSALSKAKKTKGSIECRATLQL